MARAVVQKSTTFSKSVALLSVLGWLMGLGNYHARTGGAVNIDFNVCFDTGRPMGTPAARA